MQLQLMRATILRTLTSCCCMTSKFEQDAHKDMHSKLYYAAVHENLMGFQQQIGTVSRVRHDGVQQTDRQTHQAVVQQVANNEPRSQSCATR